MSVRAEFEKLLKESHHFADVINTNRAATGQVLAGLLQVLLEDQKMSIERVHSVLTRLEERTGSPSLDSERSHIVSQLRAQLKAFKQNRH